MLIYRFPGKEIIQKDGNFEEFVHLPKNGFIVSDFKGEKRYVFKENQNSSIHFQNEHEPVIINKAEYLRKGALLITTLKSIGIKKTVYSRIKELPFNETKSLELFFQLEKAYPNAFIYLLSDENLGTWIGASPEVLLRKVQSNGFTISLAGTKSNEDNSNWTEKEKLEQAYVSDFIKEELGLLNISDIEQSDIYEHHAGPVKHLRTDFNFTMENEKIDAFLKKLHPTPAVSGLPQSLAIELIDQIEKHDRGLYAGFIGEIDDLNASIFVNLRCCQIRKGKICLYLGGGYTADSNPEQEWIETENKSKPISDLIQKV
jgi:isochorismate synthase